jgi:hypothetical protein
VHNIGNIDLLRLTMTFKHVKFEDSPVMRSLEKLAQQKGLVKSEGVNKTASSNLDLTPTANLTQNVLNLCAGLRTVNLHKMADDLEKNLMLYRQAQTLYETSKEKGEDLVDAAHPKGGHKLEDVDNKDAVFKTIVEKHLDTINMVNKKPSGKLSNAKDILRAVKVALAQNVSDLPDDISSMGEEQMAAWRNKGALQQLNLIPGILGKAYDIINKKMNTTTLASSFNSDYNKITQLVKNIGNDVTVTKVDDILSKLGDMENSIKFFNWKDWGLLNPFTALPSALRHVGDVTDIVTGDWDQSSRDEIMGIIGKAKLCANTARRNIRGENDMAIRAKLVTMKAQFLANQAAEKMEKEKEEKAKKDKAEGLTDNPLKPYFQQIYSLRSQLESWQSQGAIAKSKAASDWIKEEIKALADIFIRYNVGTDEQKALNVNALKAEVDKEAQDIAAFKASWVV